MRAIVFNKSSLAKGGVGYTLPALIAATPGMSDWEVNGAFDGRPVVTM